MVYAVAGQKGVIFRPVPKQRLHALDLRRHADAVFQPVDQFVQRHGHVVFAVHRRAQGREEVRVFRGNDLIAGQVKRADKRLPQFGKEMQRPPEKGHVAADGLAAGQAADGLVDHGLEDRRRQIFAGRTLIDQRLDIRFGEYAAAGRDRVDHPVVSGVFIQPRRVCLQERGHLVDERAGAAGADAVHPLIDAAGEIDDLGVLAAQLDRHVRLRRIILQGGRHGDDLLNEGDVQMLCQGQAAGTGNHRMKRYISKLRAGLFQKFSQCLLYVRVMALIVGEQHFICIMAVIAASAAPGDDGFDCGRTDIDSQ